MSDTQIRLVIAGVVLPLVGLAIGEQAIAVGCVVGAICLLAGLIGWATQRE